MPRSEHVAVAELLEQFAQAPDAREACSIGLAFALASGPADRGAIVLRGEKGNWRILRGLAGGRQRLAPVEGTSLGLERALGSLEPAVVEDPGQSACTGLEPCLVLPFRDAAERPLGAVLLQGRRLDSGVRFLGSVFRRCGPALGRVLQRELSGRREERYDRRNLLLSRMHDALTDPVILTNPDNDILLANRRANRLFVSRSGDSVGRTHAVRTNTFLFSAFLTQERIGDRKTGGRELNLVDPLDGSDLAFEVLTTPLPGEGGGEALLISVLRDITDLKRAVTELELEYKRSRGAEHRARQESQRLNAIIENAAEPILVTDGESRIVLMNPEAERLFDVPTETREDGHRRQVWTNVTRFTSLVNEFLLQPGVRRTERLTLTDPETERELPVQAVNTKILDRLQEPMVVVTVLRDLTQEMENERLARELRKLNDELEERIEVATGELAERNRLLEWQSRELEQVSRMKSEFLARMSHELRTPINAMLGYTSLLRERIYGELTDGQEEALERIEAASGHLLSLINEILDLAKIEAGKMPIRLEDVQLEDLASTISETIRPLVDQKDLEFRSELQDPLPTVRTDPTKLRQVLLNLLQNAVKFTNDGWVALRAARDGNEVTIEVEDTGIGIRDEHQQVIFEDFRQVDEFPTREYGGTGLGLSISRKLLALMQGSISVESVFGEGTRFTVRLPLRVEPGTLEEQALRALVRSVDGEGPGPPRRRTERAPGRSRVEEGDRPGRGPGDPS